MVKFNSRLQLAVVLRRELPASGSGNESHPHSDASLARLVPHGCLELCSSSGYKYLRVASEFRKPDDACRDVESRFALRLARAGGFRIWRSLGLPAPLPNRDAGYTSFRKYRARFNPLVDNEGLFALEGHNPKKVAPQPLLKKQGLKILLFSGINSSYLPGSFCIYKQLDRFRSRQ